MIDTFSYLVGSISFAWPYALFLIVLPALINAMLAAGGKLGNEGHSRGAIRVPWVNQLPESSRRAGSPERLAVADAFAFVFWCLLIVAVARPQWVSPENRRLASGRDLLLVYDISSSMQIEDLRANGKSVARQVAAAHYGRQFVERSQGDRVGLIVFATRPYLFVPLTHDLQAVSDALLGPMERMAGNQSAVGDAIALAVRTLSGSVDSEAGNSRERMSRSGSVILVSDGASTAGALSMEQAAWLASRLGVRIHVLGIGAEGGNASLQTLATQTQGYYASVLDQTGIEAFFQRIDRLEPTSPDRGVPLTRIYELYALPLLIAFGMLFGCMALRCLNDGRSRFFVRVRRG